MIKFREKLREEINLIPEVLTHLKSDGQSPKIIDEKDADSASKVSSKSMVLYKAVQNTDGMYEIQVMDKELYRFTKKLLTDILGLTIINIDDDKRLITAVNRYKGIVLDAIDILGRRYNLSIVVR